MGQHRQRSHQILNIDKMSIRIVLPTLCIIYYNQTVITYNKPVDDKNPLVSVNDQ